MQLSEALIGPVFQAAGKQRPQTNIVPFRGVVEGQGLL